LLDLHNKERKAIEAQVLEAAMAQAANCANQPVILVHGQGWHEGVIGIVAGRLKEAFNRPAAVITWDDNGIGKASARSVKGVDIGQAVIAARQAELLHKGGGHAMAAGFTLSRDYFEVFAAFLAQRVEAGVAAHQAEDALMIDGEVALTAAVPDFCAVLERAGPYGAGNPSPRFMLREVKVIAADVLGEKHLRCQVADAATGGRVNSTRLKVMGFGQAESQLGQQLLQSRGRPVHLVGRLKAESWQGRCSVTLFLEDAAWA
jgi:single-stranded-DNA-specific exonuclease